MSRYDFTALKLVDIHPKIYSVVVTPQVTRKIVHAM